MRHHKLHVVRRNSVQCEIGSMYARRSAVTKRQKQYEYAQREIRLAKIVAPHHNLLQQNTHTKTHTQTHTHAQKWLAVCTSCCLEQTPKQDKSTTTDRHKDVHNTHTHAHTHDPKTTSEVYYNSVILMTHECRSIAFLSGVASISP